ncbi:MAG: carboxypeptidase regulatory-like domain-containing protein [Myxococcales bacterium]|nr:carboxypeptidase regulatory-like domain-containing protein [Myxococcota bacterium]MDW8283559.1 carboxypeptidase regulatory-like domain-containing protein [Myxococcales bacterium]
MCSRILLARVGLLCAVGGWGCALRPEPQLQQLNERMERLEARLAAVEEAQRRAALEWGGPQRAEEPNVAAPPRGLPAPSGKEPSAEEVSAGAAEQTSPGRAFILGSIVLNGPYASTGGRAVALLSPLQGRTRPPRPRRAQLEQRERAFVPSLLALPVGSIVSFPNRDPVYHNVFSLSPAKRFDLGVFKQNESRDVTFDQPGVVHVLCNLHATMSAYLIVHEEPYAALADSTGRFGFRNLSPGAYRLRLWHERAAEMVQQQVVLAPGPNRVQVPVEATVAPTLPPDKEGRPRGARTAP